MTNILGIPIYDDKLEKAVSIVVQLSLLKDIKNKVPKCISATGAHGLVYARRHQEFAEILQSFYMNLPDGMPAVWVGRLKGAKKIERCYGPNIFEKVLNELKGTNIKHYFCGGKEGVAEELKKVCEGKYDNHNVVGTFSPPFREMTDKELVDLSNKINNVKTDVVWIGLSTPRQEIFAYRLSKYTNVHLLCTVGAAFDFHTGRVKQAPEWIQKMGMEWFFRLLVEPRRLWKRYLEIVPFFILYNFIELVKGDFLIKRGNE
jgi:N-acetylglucosaminyldiphosphoundecaprenol N-acetyl-beta-D-mannosaminyltransferase